MFIAIVEHTDKVFYLDILAGLVGIENQVRHDAHNNRSNRKQGNQETAYRYNTNDELLRTDELSRNTNEVSITLYKNDSNGNQLATVKRRKTDNGGEPYFNLNVTLGDNRLNDNVINHYNALNQLTSTITKDKKARYEYDAEGLRTKKGVLD